MGVGTGAGAGEGTGVGVDGLLGLLPQPTRNSEVKVTAVTDFRNPRNETFDMGLFFTTCSPLPALTGIEGTRLVRPSFAVSRGGAVAGITGVGNYFGERRLSMSEATIGADGFSVRSARSSASASSINPAPA